MNVALSWLALAVLAGAAGAPARAAQVVVPEDAAQALDRRRRPAGRLDELHEALDRLLAAHPELCRAVELGRSRGGRPIRGIVVGPSRRTRGAAYWPGGRVLEGSGEAFEPGPPTVLVLPALDIDPVVGASAALDLLAQVAGTEAKSEGASHLAQHALLVVPAPDPDAWFPDGRRRVRGLDRNFPVRWDPWPGEGPSPGPYPLSEPESRALADFLQARPNVAAAVFLRGTRRSGGATWTGENAPGGSLAAFLAEGLAMRVLDDRSRVFREATRGLRIDGWRFSRAAVAQLPRLGLAVGRIERLDRDLWQVEAEIRNDGESGTSPGDLAPRGGQVWLDLDGAELVTLAATSTRAERAPSFRLMGEPAMPAHRALPPLEAGERLRVRLWVRAAEGARCTLAVRSVRAGASEAELQLR